MRGTTGKVAVVPLGVLDEAAVGVAGGAGGRADAPGTRRWEQRCVEYPAHVVGRFHLRHEQTLRAGLHRAADRGLITGVRHPHHGYQPNGLGGKNRVLDGTRIDGRMLGVEHDEVKTGETEHLDQGPITGETLHSQRNLALPDHGE
jgi:hypothetical protein